MEYETYSFDEIPLDRDLFMVSQNDKNILVNAFIDSSGRDETVYKIGRLAIVVRRRVEDKLHIEVFANIFTRYHSIRTIVSKSDIESCIGCQNYDFDPTLLVNDNLFQSFITKKYSIFALIDADGMKTALMDNVVTDEKLLILRSKIDAIASAHTSFLFISFADSILVKTVWQGPSSMDNEGYNPEELIEIANKIDAAYFEILRLQTYCIAAQGENLYNSESLYSISPGANHVSLNSLGRTFALVFEIENAARKNIRSQLHKKYKFYFEKSLFASLQSKHDYFDETYFCAEFESKSFGCVLEYSCFTLTE